MYTSIGDFLDVARIIFQRNWRAPPKVNIQFKVNKVKIQLKVNQEKIQFKVNKVKIQFLDV